MAKWEDTLEEIYENIGGRLEPDDFRAGLTALREEVNDALHEANSKGYSEAMAEVEASDRLHNHVDRQTSTAQRLRWNFFQKNFPAVTVGTHGDVAWVTCLGCWTREYLPTGEIIEPGIS